MAGAPGTATYKGIAVPLFGESEISGTSTPSSVGQDMLTLTASSGNTADFMVFRTYLGKPGDASSKGMNDQLPVADTADKFRVGASGVWFRFAPKALTTQSNDADLSLSTADSGKFHTIGDNSSGLGIQLPTPTSGLFFFLQPSASQSSNALTYKGSTGNMVLFNDSAADAIGPGKSTAQAGTGSAWMAFSDGSKWYTTFFAALSSITPASAANQLPEITT